MRDIGLSRFYQRSLSIFRSKRREVVCSVVSVVWLLLRVSTVFANSSENFEIKLRWEKVPGAIRYKVQIGRQKNFKKIFEQTEISDPKWTWNYKMGSLGTQKRVYYRVASINRYGERGKFSKPMVILLPQPPRSVGSMRAEIQLPPIRPRPPLRTPAMNEVLTVEERKWRSAVHLKVMGNIGAGGMTQNSEAENLKKVGVQPGYLQQKLAVHLDFLRAMEEEEFQRSWSLQAQVQHASFQGVQDPRPFQQSNVSAFTAQFAGLSWNRVGRSSYRFGYGLVVERSFRWIKNGTESVAAEGGISAGPQLALVSLHHSSEWGLSVSAPFLGTWMGTYWSATGSIWWEWRLLRAQGDYGLSGWSVPESTRVTWWSGWLGVVIHLGSDDAK